MANRLFLLLALIGSALAAVAAYHWAKASVAQDVYRDRLVGLQDDYQRLAEQYNQAVTPRPVTELWVEDGEVCVVVRKGEDIVRVPTDFDVRTNEVYVDYILADQRLLIRRVFEMNKLTGVPPNKIVTIDKDLLEVDWDPQRVPYGLSLSFSGREDGRYLISATHNGSLSLKPIDENAEVRLTTRPPIKQFDPVDEQAHASVDAIGIGDVWKYLTD
ncbi:MAG: hypothetical protein ACE37H_14595 [Phycisphaeraceae bacterium]